MIMMGFYFLAYGKARTVSLKVGITTMNCFRNVSSKFCASYCLLAYNTYKIFYCRLSLGIYESFWEYIDKIQSFNENRHVVLFST